ncbi:MAG: LPS export ABC transporter periplasmic protein LptC [Deltaproteobacteria bacterium]|nr:LPS export ABC transporter periplasmic protein LptC [Deltaproteobacteria bacterium]
MMVVMVAGLGFALMSHSRPKEEEPVSLESVMPKKSDVCLNRIHHVATRDGVIHHVATRDGVKEWTLDAESAQYEKAGSKTVFKDISATFFLEGGRDVTLSSRDGVLLTDTKDMEIWGDVVARSGSYQLNTNRIRYDHKAQVLSTKTPIVIKGKGLEITGDRMTFDLQTEHVVVQGQVQAVLEDFML